MQITESAQSRINSRGRNHELGLSILNIIYTQQTVFRQKHSEEIKLIMYRNEWLMKIINIDN